MQIDESTWLGVDLKWSRLEFLQTEQSHHTKGLIRLTMACNERCPFCNVPMEAYATLTTPEDALAEQVEVLVSSGAQTATISGGEPTLLRKRLLALILEVRSREIPFVELQTNAVLIDLDYASALAKVGVTSAFVSLLSHLPEHHDVLCGLKGAFSKCLTGIDALLDAGIQVTLNPVVAAQTQELVEDYVAFVGERFPRIKSLSLSAVQPHGRAAQNVELMPDYSVLSVQIPLAMAKAKTMNITLLNPYCGLPLCVGWTDQMGHSVEAQEALSDPDSRVLGVDNLGNKRHGEPCKRCALRTRCGGAWHAYWDVRDGAGVVPPEVLGRPWRADWVDSEGQSRTVIEDVEQAERDLRAQSTPTRWVVSEDLEPEALSRLCVAGATDWVWRVDGSASNHKKMLTGMRHQIERQRGWPEQFQVKLVWCIEGPVSLRDAHRWVGLAYAMGVTRVLLSGASLGAEFWTACEIRYRGIEVERLDEND